MKNYLHPHYINVISVRISSFLWSIANLPSAWWWGVKMGRGCSFRGKIRWNLLPDTQIKVGNHCTFNSSHSSNLIGVYTPCIFSTLKSGAHIIIGDDCGFSGTVIGCAKSITLGEKVRCGANTMITDTDWHTDDTRTGENKEIVIGDNVWLGYGVKVLKGVRIGENTLIGACSVVTKDIPANVVAAGNPCKVIKSIYEK